MIADSTQITEIPTSEQFVHYFEQNLPLAQNLLGNLGSMAATNVGNTDEIANAVTLQTSLGIAASFMKLEEFATFVTEIDMADSPIKKQALLRAKALMMQAEHLKKIDGKNPACKLIVGRLNGSAGTLKLAIDTNSLSQKIHALSPLTSDDQLFKDSPFAPGFSDKLKGSALDFELLQKTTTRLTTPKPAPAIQLHA